ncbi:MAG TPA: protein kinase [Pyrinomonadaceae bacterium]|jgi:serine/threonine protein kinase/tetratricopeptide (TPR) repeat protein
MSSERWDQIDKIFQTAVGLPPDERTRYIAEACAGDEQLRTKLEALVSQTEESGGSAAELEAEKDDRAALVSSHILEGETMRGKRIGAYQIVREVGRGGMGAVYLAERADSEFRRRVAIKLIKRGMDTDFIIRRFRNERQILAALEHPNIGCLLDGGTTEDGLPYFVMEYIEGRPLYRYCDAARLNIRERLRLFSQICAALHYAHQNLVIHRDLKPSNILVTHEGVPKLLDFGIAKLLNPDLAPNTLDPTATSMRLMTPEYASPEQVQGLTMTPASDIYSLGVLLYELLTGHRPYRIRSRMPHEVARVVCEEHPERPSLAVTRPDEVLPFSYSGGAPVTLTSLCEARGGTPESLRRELAGGLDNVILKSLQKEPRQRYKTAEQLREDILRYLDGHPVSAPAYAVPLTHIQRPGTNEPETGEETIAVLPLKTLNIGGTTGDNYLSIGLTDALITRLSSLRRFTVRPTGSVLRYAGNDTDPFVAGRELGTNFVLDGRVTTIGERIRVTVQLLNVGQRASVWAGKFDERLTDVLSLEDAISARVAEALVPHLTGSERQRLAKRPTDNPEAFEAYLRGRSYWNNFTEEGFAQAITYYHRAVELDPHYAAAYAGIADYYIWLGIYGVRPAGECYVAAKEAAQKAIELDDTLGEAYTALGFASLAYDFDWAASEALHRRAIELSPNYPTAHLWYSLLLVMEGRFEEGIREARRAVELDPLATFNQHHLAWSLYHARRYDESIEQYRKVLDADPQYSLSRFSFSWSLLQRGFYEEAIAESQRAVELSGGIPFMTAGLASAYARAGRIEEAHALLRKLRELPAERQCSPYHLALVYCNLGETEEALALLEQAFIETDAWLVWLGVEAQLEPLRSDPRFEKLLRRTRNPLPAQTEASLRRLHAGQTGGEKSGPATPAPSSSGSGPLASGGATSIERHTDNEEAHQLYVAGRYFSIKRTAEGLRLAIERFEQAVARDPRFALAYAELADCYALLNWYVEPPPPGAFERAKQAALKAVEADESLADAHASLGFVMFHYDRDWAGAEREFRRAIELKPQNAPAHRWYAFSLSAMGRHQEAFREIKRAQEISPRSPVIATGVANVLFLARRFDEAIEQCHKALELDPGSIAAHVVLRWAYECKGMHEEALAIYEHERVFAGDTPTTRAKRAHVLAASGRTEEAREILREILSLRDQQWVTAYEIAIIYSLLDQRDEALHWLAQAEKENAVGLTYVQVDPHLDNLRQDPRFEEWLHQSGIIG